MDISGIVVDVDQTSHTLVIKDTNDVFHTVTSSPLSTYVPRSGLRVNIVHDAIEGHNDRHDALLVVEPDVVVDITEAAGYVTDSPASAELAIPKRLQGPGFKAEAYVGNLVNTAFDLLVAHPDSSDDELFRMAVSERPLTGAAAVKHGYFDEHRARVLEVIPRLREMIESLGGGKIILEPFFISERLGLQGRADICVLTQESVRMIEMKSGRAYAKRTLRADHEAQAAGYAALAHVAGERRKISSELWYVMDPAGAVAPIPDAYRGVVRLVDARNKMIDQDRLIAARSASAFSFMATLPEGLSSYDRAAVTTLQDHIRSLDVEERLALRAWIGHATAEQLLARSQQNSNAEPLHNLVLNVDGSDFSSLHLRFSLTEQHVEHPYRVGDPVVLRPPSGGNDDMIAGSYFKAVIRSIDKTSVEVSLRNKFAGLGATTVTTPWTLAADGRDATSRAMYGALRWFIECSPARRQVLMGRRPPRSGVINEVHAPDLTSEQRRIVASACAAEEMFLIQGPPGTGKTSSVLRTIVTELLHNADERLLCVAYTNRAANEICSVLSRHSVDHVRHGSKEGANVANSIPYMGQHMDAPSLSRVLQESRVVVSTASALYSGPEIWDMGLFTTLIVDEASQILEPLLLGMMSRCSRSILIGDQCQLPAVVPLSKEETSITAESLVRMHLTSTALSGFERLMEQSSQWPGETATAMLTKQGRMHSSIMKVASELFYGGQLQVLAPEQNTTQELPWHDVLPHRATKIIETGGRDAEAQLIVKIVHEIVSRVPATFNVPSIGIITPFRMQNNAIVKLLSPEFREFVDVDTVERFQGSERDVIIYGTAVESAADLESITSESVVQGVPVDRKLNVAITRARSQFVLVGNDAVLSASSSYTKLLSLLPESASPR